MKAFWIFHLPISVVSTIDI